jgi:hypothetical protein
MVIVAERSSSRRRQPHLWPKDDPLANRGVAVQVRPPTPSWTHDRRGPGWGFRCSLLQCRWLVRGRGPVEDRRRAPLIPKRGGP